MIAFKNKGNITDVISQSLLTAIDEKIILESVTSIHIVIDEKTEISIYKNK